VFFHNSVQEEKRNATETRLLRQRAREERIKERLKKKALSKNKSNHPIGSGVISRAEQWLLGKWSDLDSTADGSRNRSMLRREPEIRAPADILRFGVTRNEFTLFRLCFSCLLRVLRLVFGSGGCYPYKIF
jgi:hypothetical protein